MLKNITTSRRATTRDYPYRYHNIFNKTVGVTLVVTLPSRQNHIKPHTLDERPPIVTKFQYNPLYEESAYHPRHP